MNREFHDMSKKISCATTVLMDSKSAASEIDRVLNEMLSLSLPGYIGVPTDVCYTPIPASSLRTPLNIDLPRNETETERKAIANIRKLLEASTKPIIIIDGGATRHDVLTEVTDLCKVTKLPYFTNPWGKGCVTEENPRFGGLYVGLGSKADIREAVESSDCVLWIGKLSSDFNTAEFTESVKLEAVIEFQRFWMSIGEKRIDLKMKWLLQNLVSDLEKAPLKMKNAWSSMPCTPYTSLEPRPSGKLTQASRYSSLYKLSLISCATI